MHQISFPRIPPGRKYGQEGEEIPVYKTVSAYGQAPISLDRGDLATGMIGDHRYLVALTRKRFDQ